MLHERNRSSALEAARNLRIRAASEADMAAVRDIYAHYVLHSLATFEETPPALEDDARAPARVDRARLALSRRRD